MLSPEAWQHFGLHLKILYSPPAAINMSPSVNYWKVTTQFRDVKKHSCCSSHHPQLSSDSGPKGLHRPPTGRRLKRSQSWQQILFASVSKHTCQLLAGRITLAITLAFDASIEEQVQRGENIEEKIGERHITRLKLLSLCCITNGSSIIPVFQSESSKIMALKIWYSHLPSIDLRPQGVGTPAGQNTTTLKMMAESIKALKAWGHRTLEIFTII